MLLLQMFAFTGMFFHIISPLCFPPLQVTFRLLLWRWERGTPPALRLSSLHRSPSRTTPPAARCVTVTTIHPFLKASILILSPCEHRSYHSSFLREQCRCLCLTPPWSIQAAAPVAQPKARRGWWLCLDLATRWGSAFQPMAVCTVWLTCRCSTTSATLPSSQRLTAQVRRKT